MQSLRNSAHNHGSFGKPICLCAWLTSFQPALVPPPQTDDVDSDVESYSDAIDDSDYDADEREDD